MKSKTKVPALILPYLTNPLRVTRPVSINLRPRGGGERKLRAIMNVELGEVNSETCREGQMTVIHMEGFKRVSQKKCNFQFAVL